MIFLLIDWCYHFHSKITLDQTITFVLFLNYELFKVRESRLSFKVPYFSGLTFDYFDIYHC